MGLLDFLKASFMEGLNGLGEIELAIKEANIKIENGDPCGYYDQFMIWQNPDDLNKITVGPEVIEIIDKAFALNEQGANMGNMYAQFNYSCLLAVKQRYAERVEWLRKAANNGLYRAQGQLAYVLATGSTGCAQDLEEAEYWAKMSYQQAEDFDVKSQSQALLEAINAMKNNSI